MCCYENWSRYIYAIITREDTRKWKATDLKWTKKGALVPWRNEFEIQSWNKIVVKSLRGSRKGLETYMTNKNIHIYQKEDRNSEEFCALLLHELSLLRAGDGWVTSPVQGSIFYVVTNHVLLTFIYFSISLDKETESPHCLWHLLGGSRHSHRRIIISSEIIRDAVVVCSIRCTQFQMGHSRENKQQLKAN